MESVVSMKSRATPAYYFTAKKGSLEQSRRRGNPVLSYKPTKCNLELPLRRSANYQPSLWKNDFLQSLTTSSNKEEHSYTRIQILKNEVLQILSDNKELKSQLELIDDLEQLGVAYHFKEEIHNVLREISNLSSENISIVLKDDLCATSLLFRLLRQHGFSVSQGIFINYMDEKGTYKLQGQDIKGILNLYEASYVAKDGEAMMDEARMSTIKELENILDKSLHLDPRSREHIIYALELPLDRRVTRLHNRWYIEAYQSRDLINPILLELAKLDYNAVQMMFKNELKDASRWWTELGLAQNLPFSRDRLVENYFMSVGFACEPQYQNFREASMKANCFVTAIDDIYDIYGTLEELELFTSVINSWDVHVANKLPDYMKICFFALLSTINETADKIMKLTGLDITPLLKKAWTEICNSYLVEAKWYHMGHKPQFEEYLGNAWITISGALIFMHGFCANEHITSSDLQNFRYPSIARWTSTIGRLCDDLATSEDELQRGDVLKSIQCYMLKNEVPETIARQKINEIINGYWKQVNGKGTFSSSHEQFYNDVAINFARMAHCIYQDGDGYAKPDGATMKRILSVLIEPIKF